MLLSRYNGIPNLSEAINCAGVF